MLPPWTLIHRCYRAMRWHKPKPRLLLRQASGMAAWPVYVGYWTFRCTRLNGAIVRARSGRSIAAQVAGQFRCAFLHGIAPFEYYIFELYEDWAAPRATEYLTRSETKGGVWSVLRGRPKSPLKDKLAFSIHCAEHGLSVVPVLVAFDGGKLVHPAGAPLSLPKQDLFVKPSPGKGGRGPERWDFVGEGRWRGETGELLAEPALIARLQRLSMTRARIVQPRAVNHPDMADLSNGALCSLRIVTARNDRGGFEATNAALRMARGSNRTVDNLHRGGIGAAVDVRTGRLGRASNRGHIAALGWLESHPDTGARIFGRDLPCWRDTIALVEAAHGRAFNDRFVIGWDVAILSDGPALVEGNSNPDLDIIQRVERAPSGSARLGQLAASALLQTRLGQAVARSALGRRVRRFFFCAAAGLCVAAAPKVAGDALIIDADTLVIQGQEVQLYGIDAPETQQLCLADGKRYGCGKAAAAALASLIGDRSLSCSLMGRASDGDNLVLCRVDGADIQDWLVEQGWALADAHQTRAYVDEEVRAEAEDKGLWRGSVVGSWAREQD